MLGDTVRGAYDWDGRNNEMHMTFWWGNLLGIDHLVMCHGRVSTFYETNTISSFA
jgi:hypothetical protein